MNSPLKPGLIDATIEPPCSTWNARLHLEFAKRPRGVRLVKSEHEGPLYVQKAFYPEGPECAHVYLLHPPGGLVSGDTLNIDITASEGAHALITTPGAGRVYNAREKGGVQTQNLQLTVGHDAVLEFFPLETILFPNAQARMHTRIDLADRASIITWEVTCFGLPANGVAFDSGSAVQSLKIWQNNRLMLNEGLVIDGEGESADLLNGNAGLRQRPVHGLMLAGPFDIEPVELIETLRLLASQTGEKEWLAVSQNGAFLTVRYLGACTERARKLFTLAWASIRPELIKKESMEPRIWAT
jgi:urease accessory protein